jgi:hypothetical protein
MNAPESLVLDLVEWIAQKPRSLDEVMDAWRTSCPRLPVWEDAVDFGYVDRNYVEGTGVMVSASSGGTAFLQRNGRRSAVSAKIA